MWLVYTQPLYTTSLVTVHTLYGVDSMEMKEPVNSYWPGNKTSNKKMPHGGMRQKMAWMEEIIF